MVSPTGLPTEYNPSVSHRELQKKLRDCATFTDEFTDGVTDIHYRRNHRRITHIPKRMHVWHVSVCTYTDVLYRRKHRRIYALPEAHACLTRVRLHEYRRIEKFGGIFEIFLVRNSINFRWNYRWNLMPPTTINVRR